MMVKKVKSFWNSLEGMTTVSKRELFFGMTTCALAGVLLGIIFFPRHMMIGSNNGNHSANANSGAWKDGSDSKGKHEKDKAECGEKQMKEKNACCNGHKNHKK
jgi:hypothetical protein